MLGTEWIWELKNLASQPLGVLFNDLNRVDGAAVVAESHIGAIGADDYGFSNLNMNLGKTKKQVDEVSDSAVSMGGLFKAAIVGAASLFAISGFGQIGADIYNTGTAMEQTSIAFTTLLQDATLAKTKIAELQSFADVSPFNTKEVFDAGVSLTGFGIKAEGLIPVMNVLGDASMGNGNKFKSLVDNYGKLISAQRVTTIDLNQFAIQGVPIWQELGKIMNKSGAELRDAVENGGASTAMVTQALQNMTAEGGQFFGMMAQQALSTEGRMSTFLSKIEALEVKIFNGLQPFINSMIDLGISVLPIVENGLKFIVDNADVIEGLGVAATVAAGGWVLLNAQMLIGEGLWMAGAAAVWAIEAAQWAWNAAMMANPLGLIVGALAGGIYIAWQRSEGFREVMYGLLEVTKAVGEAFMGLGEIIIGSLTFDAAMVARGIDTISNFGENIGEAYAKGAAKGAASFAEDTGVVGATDATSATGEAGANKSVVTAENTASGGGKETTMKGDSAAKIINVRIENLGKEITVNTAGGVREGAQDVRRIIHEELIAAVRDFEIGLSNG